MSADVFIGIDLGTSGLKAVALQADGRLAGRAAARYPTARPVPGASEQDPAHWLAALRSAVAELADSVAPSRWRAAALSGMIPTLVAVDGRGRPVGPAVTWEDSRAEAVAAQLRDRAGAAAVYQLTGQWLDGRYLLPMLACLEQRRPDAAAGIARIAGAKDYLLWWLTGEWLTDPTTATGYGCYDLRAGTWAAGVMEAAAALQRRPLPALPDVADPAAWLPLARERAADLGIPADVKVVTGAADSVLAALGLGVREPGEVAYVAGTSTVILGVSDRMIADPAHRYLITPLAGIEGWGLEMDLLATGSAIRWLSELLGSSETDLVGMAGQIDPLDAPRFLPFLAPGEQGALWNPLLTGTITDLSLHHRAPHLARGLLNGITLESRRCLRLLAEVTGRAGTVRLAGASASAQAFQQDLADASGRAVAADSSFADYSALGAALLAAQAAGAPMPQPQLPPAANSRVAGGENYGQVIAPRPGRSGRWQELAARHDELLAAVGPDVPRGLAGHPV